MISGLKTANVAKDLPLFYLKNLFDKKIPKFTIETIKTVTAFELKTNPKIEKIREIDPGKSRKSGIATILRI